MTTLIHTVTCYAPDGGAWTRTVFEGSYDECLAYIRERIGTYMDDPECRWAPPEEGDLVGFNAGASEGCGGYIIHVEKVRA